MSSTPILPQGGDIFQRVKTLPFPEVLRILYGVEPRHNKILCPFHRDIIPSFHLFEDGFFCFGCGEYGDSVAFVSKLNGLRPIDAAKTIAQKFGMFANNGPLSVENRFRLAREKAEQESIKEIDAAFKQWVKEAIVRIRRVTEAIRFLMMEDGVDIDKELLPLVHLLPWLEWVADTLGLGTDEEKLALFRNKEVRWWAG